MTALELGAAAHAGALTRLEEEKAEVAAAVAAATAQAMVVAQLEVEAELEALRREVQLYVYTLYTSIYLLI